MFTYVINIRAFKYINQILTFQNREIISDMTIVIPMVQVYSKKIVLQGF